MRLVALALALGAWTAAPANAQFAPHLVPQVGPPVGTDALVGAIAETLDSLRVDGLSFALDRDVIAWNIDVGGLGTPDTRAVVIRRVDGGYVGLWALGSPWYDGKDEAGTWSAERARRVHYDTGAAVLDSTVALAVGAVWALAVLGTRHQRPEEVEGFIVLDGSSSYYARWIDYYGVASGWSRGAPPGSPAARLAWLSGMLLQHLRGPEDGSENVVTADALTAEAQDVLRVFDPEGHYRLAE